MKLPKYTPLSVGGISTAGWRYSPLLSLQCLALLASIEALNYHFGGNFELVFLNSKEGKIHEFFRHRSAQAAAYGQ